MKDEKPVQFGKIEDGYGRRYDVLHAIVNGRSKTACSVMFGNWFTSNNTTIWYLTDNPFGHFWCSSPSCRKLLSKNATASKRLAGV